MISLGLVGFNVVSGLGVLNRQMSRHLPVGSWLVRSHRYLPTLPVPSGVERAATTNELLDLSDVVLFAENPLWPDLPKQAKVAGKRVVCIPMQEWMPEDLETWPQYVDSFLCPTRHCYDQFKNQLSCRYVPWPIDVERFHYRQRQVCRRFLFVDGNGGWQDRKGSNVIQEAQRLWPEMPLVVYSQRDVGWPSGTDYRGRANTPCEMYASGDVLLCPHSVDGIGLEIGEALASGMPVIATDGRPWDEYPLLAEIPARMECRRMPRRNVDWYLPDSRSLVTVCKRLLGADIGIASVEAGLWARSHAWDRWTDKITKLVLG